MANAKLEVLLFFFFFFNDTATTEIYTLSLHDALPIWGGGYSTRLPGSPCGPCCPSRCPGHEPAEPSASGSPPTFPADRKSTRLNSSHSQISYAVFCLKKKKKKHESITSTITSYPPRIP